MAITGGTDFTVSTSHGKIAVSSIGTGSPAILLIHGNSFCRKIFRHVLNDDILLKDHQIIAFDLPGHGESSNALEPEKSYTMPGYAAAAVELLGMLGISEVIVLGWSLGGHIGIEMLPLFPGLKGLMLVGAPPVDHGEIGKGFTFGTEDWTTALAARDDLTEEEITEFALGCADPPYEDWMREAVARTDPEARSIMFKGFASGKVLNQRTILEKSNVTIAVVNGKREPFLNLEWMRANVKPKILWGRALVEIDGLKHAPFWGGPEKFEPILCRFVEDVSGSL
jgi:pimeloyl-ACP methyl ester carboxylesterase